jgi:hypothetical protein
MTIAPTFVSNHGPQRIIASVQCGDESRNLAIDRCRNLFTDILEVVHYFVVGKSNDP